MNKFKDMLHYLRERDGITQLELGEKINMSRGRISMYEAGKREPDFETLKIFADYFNVDMNFLLGNDSATNDQTKAFAQLFKKLSSDQQKNVMEYMQYLSSKK